MAISKSSKLRRLISDHTVMVPGAFNPIVAMMTERLGFEAIYISGAGLANSNGLPDIGLLTMSEVLEQSSRIADSVKIPAIVDVDTGFGEVLNAMRTIEEFEKAGISAIQIEDQEMPKRCGHLPGKSLVTTKTMLQKITGAVEARKNPDFMIIARTDARAIEGLDGAIKRARVYVEAGADIIFPEALASREEFRQFAKAVKVPLMANMTEFGKTPYISVKEFANLGYKIVIFPMTAFRVMTKAVEDALKELKKNGTQKNLLGKMHTRQQIYDMIRYSDYEEIDRRIGGRSSGQKRR